MSAPRVDVQPAHLRLLGADVGRRADELLELREQRLFRQFLQRGLGDAEVESPWARALHRAV
jgi:hypothetical protein